jgi:branched-chain amino acid transport system ATP-binding protein
VLQNIAVAALFGRGLTKPAAEQEAANVLSFIGLEKKKDMLAGDLEEISLKRLELARVLATKPTVLMIDELAAGLTDTEIPPVLDLLKAINKKGITIILIEHVMKVMTKAVDRIIVMEEGAKIAEGEPAAIMKNKKVIKAYLG